MRIHGSYAKIRFLPVFPVSTVSSHSSYDPKLFLMCLGQIWNQNNVGFIGKNANFRFGLPTGS